MANHEMLTTIDGPTLAAAFTIENRVAAIVAGIDAARRLVPRQWTEQFAVKMGSETIMIPARLHFASEKTRLPDDAEAWLFVRALQTRSNNGFERQRAARELLGFSEPSVVPFIVALIGEYVVEILDDIAAGLTPGLEYLIGSFIVCNPTYWNTTKRRVTSYWNVYYRARWLIEHGRAERRDEYVGFRLIKQLEAAALRTPTVSPRPRQAIAGEAHRLTSPPGVPPLAPASSPEGAPAQP